MRSLLLQLKSTSKDKMCVLSFLLPIIMSVCINVIDASKFNTSYELEFGYVRDFVSSEAVSSLEKYGTAKVYDDLGELESAIINPKNSIIGIEENSGQIQIKIAGDETDYIKNIAHQLQSMQNISNLPDLSANTTILKLPNLFETYKDIFTIITLIIAMFMGCVYNAMNMISEKEDGIEYINKVLPLNGFQYLLQKIMIGLIFCIISSVITAFLCLDFSAKAMSLAMIIIILSAIISSLVGIVIGKVSDGMLVGITIIKVVMIIFMVLPLITYFFMKDFESFKWLFYIVPSTATFDGIMSLITNNVENAVQCIVILVAECTICTLLFLIMVKKKKLRTSVETSC